MVFDFFHSKLDRALLARVYSGYYEHLMGSAPQVDAQAGRAQLCSLIEELEMLEDGILG